MPKILTIVIPAYKVEVVINRALMSLDYQYGKDFNVLIVDDGSPKPIKKIIHSWIERYPSIIKVVRKKNGNWGSVINCAAAHVNTRFLKVLDADDTFNFFELSKTIDYLKNMDKDVDLVLSSFYFVLDLKQNKVIYRRITHKSSIVYTSFDRFKTNHILTHHAIYFNTKFLQDRLHLEENFRFSDNILLYRAILFSKKIALLPKNSFLYEYHIGIPQQQSSLEQMIHYYHDAQKTFNIISQIKVHANISNQRKKTLFIILKAMYYLSLILIALNKNIYLWQKKINFRIINKYINQAKINGYEDFLKKSSISVFNSLGHRPTLTISKIAFKLIRVGFIRIVKDGDRLMKNKKLIY